jgi:putative ABC transport system permease protein
MGEGLKHFMLAQFTQFGTNIIAINPGKTETLGLPGVTGGTTQKLTIADAESLERIHGVTSVMPLYFGQARVEAAGRGRSVYVYGVTSDMPETWQFGVAVGRFLPEGDARRGGAVAVLGPTLERELFGTRSSLGEFIRIGGTRLRVLGVVEPKGQFLGIDIDDTAYIPVATAMQIFNSDELAEIDITYQHAGQLASVEKAVREILTARHSGREDFTITTQEAMLDVFGNVMEIITVSVGAIGGISLLVGAIGILTMMWISVGERTPEIGLMRSLGATSGQVLTLFMAEAIALSLLGGALGLAAGGGIAGMMRVVVPGLPLSTPPEFVAAAVGVAALTGVLAGVLPARRAAGLDPVDALRAD